MKIPDPSHREQVALFRLGVVGDLLARDLDRGELQAELHERAKKRYRRPGATRSHTYSWKTLQRWYYEAKQGPSALVPRSRARGFAQALTDDQRDLLLQMRRQNRSAPIDLILSEAVRNGVIEEGVVSVSTLARLFRNAGLTRLSRKKTERKADVQRRRWQSEHPGDLWHGDVCHLRLPDGLGGLRTVLVHGFMDDASRHFTALAARANEEERDMLEVLCGALLQHPPPKTLYLDNGSCYRGDVLGLVCQRLGIRLVHAPPYSPENRGKMERVWRTMRQRCTDYLAGNATLHDIDLALWAWLDADYHRKPHAALMGDTPRRRYLAGKNRRPLTAGELARALEVTGQRQVRKDGTFQIDCTVYEAAGRHLAGKRITVVTDGMTGRLLRASYQDQPVRFGVCDPVANSRRKRAPVATEPPAEAVPFNPIADLLQKAREVGDE